jgi:hypothetical protein
MQDRKEWYELCVFMLHNFVTYSLYLQVVDSQSLDSLSSVELTHLPLEVQVSVQHLVSSVHSLFMQLEVHEDIYSLGHLSGLVANQLDILPDANNRRKVSALFSAHAINLDLSLKCRIAEYWNLIKYFPYLDSC